ncbi:MAG: hypothetical protein ACRC5T_07665 [Cetobacterium sp.]
MIIDYDEISELVNKLADKIGVSLEEEITLGEIVKKVQNQNLCYHTNLDEINLIKPTQKNAFFIKNAEFIINEETLDGIDIDEIIAIKLINSKRAFIKTFSEKKRVKYNGSNISVRINKTIPLDAYLEMLN